MSFIIKGNTILFEKAKLPEGWTEEKVNLLLLKAKAIDRKTHKYINIHTGKQIKYGKPGFWYGEDHMICGQGQEFDQLVEWIADN